MSEEPSQQCDAAHTPFSAATRMPQVQEVQTRRKMGMIVKTKSGKEIDIKGDAFSLGNCLYLFPMQQVLVASLEDRDWAFLYEDCYTPEDIGAVFDLTDPKDLIGAFDLIRHTSHRSGSEKVQSDMRKALGL